MEMKLIKRGDLMVTREDAIRRCERKLPNKRIYDGTCRECYYFDSRCELRLNSQPRFCYSYRDDIFFTNIVRRNILDNPQWVKENWEQLCEVDKQLFNAIYGDNTIIGGSARCGKTERQRLARERIKKILDDGFKVRCPKCGADLPKYPYYDEYYEIRTCPDCGKVYRKKRVGVK